MTPPLPRLLRSACAALLLVLAACSHPAMRTGERREWTLELKDAKAPRTTEGARVPARVTLSATATHAIDGSPQELERGLRSDARAWLEAALRANAAAARDPDPRPLATALEARGLKLERAVVTSLEVPGGASRAELAPTTDLRILLVGLDGFDWDVAEPLMAQGRMPALSGLVKRGSHARLQTIPPILSPVVWTSIATGRKPQDHGILDFLGTDAKGDPVPVTSNLRRTKAFWNVMTDAGVDTGVVGWWATWPAEPVRGFIVSDRVAYQLFGLSDQPSPTAGKVHPPALWSEVEPLIVKPRDVSQDELRPYLSPSDAPMDAQDRELLDQFAGVIAQARTYAAIGLKLQQEKKPRVGAYYFEAPDTTSHLFMRFAPPPLPEIDPVRRKRWAGVVDRVYELHDRILGRFLELADDKTVVIACSDHGFRSGSARPSKDSRVETPTAADWHERLGVFAAAGPGIKKGHEIAEASVLDVFPTMLALLGMPVADDLAGHVLDDAIEPDFLAAHPVRHVPTFETGAKSADSAFAEASPEDRAILEQLVAIGYVSSAALGGGTTGTAGASGAAAPGGNAQSEANAHNNLGTVLLQQGDLDAAEAEFRKTVAGAPDFVAGHVNLAHVLIRQGHATEAEAELRRALALEPSNPRALSLFASVQLSAGNVADAERIARGAIERDPRSAAGWFTLGQVVEKGGRLDEARDDYRKASELDPDNPEPLNALGNSFEAQGRWADAATWYERAMKVDPTYAAAYNNLALQQQRLGQLDRALATYEEGRRRLPHSSILLNNLATWHHLRAQQSLAQGRSLEGADPVKSAAARDQGLASAKKATDLYHEAMDANALDASPVNNLGALEGELGHADEQLRLYRRAVEIDPQYGDAWHNIGLWMLDRGRFQEAHEAFEKAIAAKPAEASMQMDALALVRMGNAAEAARRLEAVVGKTRSPALLATLGSVLDSQGRHEEACRRWREALALDPKMPELRARIAAQCGG